MITTGILGIGAGEVICPESRWLSSWYVDLLYTWHTWANIRLFTEEIGKGTERTWAGTWFEKYA